MKKRLFLLFALFAMGAAMQVVIAQNSKTVILNLKTGYSVKGEIIEQTPLLVKIKTTNGEIFEYKADEITNTTESKIASPSSKIFASAKKIPLSIAKADMLLSGGFGFISNFPADGNKKLTIPAVPISFEYVVADGLFSGNGAVGVGALIGYSAAKEIHSDWTTKNSRFLFGIRGYVHYALVEKLDTYGGILLGYKSDVTSEKYTGDNTYYNDEDHKWNDDRTTANLFVGCRYFFNDKIAGMAELGWGISIITVGVTVKL